MVGALGEGEVWQQPFGVVDYAENTKKPMGQYTVVIGFMPKQILIGNINVRLNTVRVIERNKRKGDIELLCLLYVPNCNPMK